MISSAICAFLRVRKEQKQNEQNWQVLGHIRRSLKKNSPPPPPPPPPFHLHFCKPFHPSVIHNPTLNP